MPDVREDNSHSVICLTRKRAYSLNVFTESSAKDKVFLVIDIRIVVTSLWTWAVRHLSRPRAFILHWLVAWLPGWLSGEESACSTGDTGLIRGCRRSPGEGNGKPLYCSCLGDPTDLAIIHRGTRVGRDLVTKTSAGLVHGYFQVTNYQNMCLRFVHLVYIFQEEFYEIKYVAPFAIGVELWTV